MHVTLTSHSYYWLYCTWTESRINCPSFSFQAGLPRPGSEKDPHAKQLKDKRHKKEVFKDAQAAAEIPVETPSQRLHAILKDHVRLRRGLGTLIGVDAGTNISPHDICITFCCCYY